MLYPSLVEVDRVIGLLPLVRGGVWFVTLFGRGVVVVWLRAYPSVVRWCLREEFGTPIVVTNPPRWRFPRWKYSGLEILLGEGGDVELGARTSKHIFVFAFDPCLSNSLSLSFFYLCKASFILPYHISLLVLSLH